MTEQDIDNLLSKGERITMECKKAAKSVPDSFWSTYSAFANTNGGIVFLGISENKGAAVGTPERYPVTGVEDIEKVRTDLWNLANNPQKVSINLLHDEDIQTLTYQGKEILAIHVPRADYKQRPVYINNNLQTGCYKRNHEGDYHCTPQELRLMLRDSDPDSNDSMFMEYYGMDDIDPLTLKHYRQRFENYNPDHTYNHLDNKEFLTALGGYTINRRENTEGLTMAGLLMFGKGLPVREVFDNFRMDYIDKTNLIGDQRYSDRLTYDGTWENNLYNFYSTVMPRLTRDLPRPFKMEGTVRIDDTPQHKAVREAFTNAIIHSDFQVGSGLLRIEKYDDKFVLTNPGLLKLSLEQIYAGGDSKARNQRMQNMLRMIGLGENLGSGFSLILNAWKEKHWSKPELIEQPELMQVKLILPLVDAHAQNVQKNVQKDVQKELTERQKNIIEILKSEPTITLDELSKRMSTSLKTVQRDLDTFRQMNILHREGGKTYGSWIITL